MADHEVIVSNGLADESAGQLVNITADSNAYDDGIIPLSVYRIHNDSCPLKSIELYFGSSAINTPAQIWETSEDEHFFRQLWAAKPGQGVEQIPYALQNLRSGTYMELFKGGAQNGTHVHGQPARQHTADQALWYILPSVHGHWRLKNKASNSYLTLRNGRSSNGTSLQGWQCNDDDKNQFWTFERMSRSPLEVQKYLHGNTLTRSTHFHHYLPNNHQYLIPPKEIIERVWQRAGLGHIAYEPGVFGSDSFAIGFKTIIHRAILDSPVQAQGFDIMCGIVFAERPADHERHALNWFCLVNGESGCTEISFFEPRTGIWDSNAFGYTKLCFGLY